VGHADIFDYVWAFSSTIKCVVGQVLQSPTFLLRLAIVLWPFASLVALFAGFIAWNGGVVLGDKSNHVATIHLPQVLYLFAYMAFFSLPLVLPALAAALGRWFGESDILAPYANQFRPRRSAHAQGKSGILTGSVFDLGSFIVVLFFTICFALPAIHFNTIIHPFTLADNRHYVFYVFRILRLYPVLRYAAAPAYVICAWLLVQQLGALPIVTKLDRVSGGATSGMTGDAATAPRVSFVLVWFATSALCLVTAPLVEPRYFILPWIVWRLQVLSPGMTPAGEKDLEKKQASGLNRLRVLYHGDYRFYAETAWFILINGATAYIFLNWGFEWPQEPGAVQRFLW
jgi:alpha-1,2-glucosyltransferase